MYGRFWEDRAFLPPLPFHPWVAPKRPILNRVKIVDASWDSDRFNHNVQNKMSIYDLNKTADSVESGLFECKNVYLKLTCVMWLMISIKYGFIWFFPLYYGFICSPLKPHCYFCLISSLQSILGSRTHLY